MAPELDLVTDSPGMIVGSRPVGGRPSLGPLGVQSLGVRDGLMGVGGPGFSPRLGIRWLLDRVAGVGIWVTGEVAVVVSPVRSRG
jgi:hypothetical protein